VIQLPDLRFKYRATAAVCGRFDQPCIKPQLRRTEANQFLEELEGLLLREAIQEPDEADLVGKANPVMRAPALAELQRKLPRLGWRIA
jgi:hypothetical protein